MKLRNKVLAGLLSLCAVFAGAGIATAKNEVKVTAAETNYTVVETSVMLKLCDIYHLNGNFELMLVLPQLDHDIKITEDKKTAEAESVIVSNFAGKLDAIGLFDNIVIEGKTLREYGCTGVYSDEAIFGKSEPQNSVIIPLHADPELWAPLVTEKGGSVTKLVVSIKEGGMLPGYDYLAGGANPVVYQVGCEYTTAWSTRASYNYETIGETTVEKVAYTQGHDGANGYLGVSLVGDDYLGNGDQLALNQTLYGHYIGFYPETFFTKSILVNGEKGKVEQYGLVNLGDAGKGMFSFQINVPEIEVETITIPAGTIFPAKAITDYINKNHALVFLAYEVQQTVTYYRTESGEFMSYLDFLVAELNGYKAEDGYFRADEAAQRTTIVNNAITALRAAETQAEMDSLVVSAKAAIDALKSAAQYADEELAPLKASARETISGYKADVAYLEESATVYAQAVEDGLAAVAAAKNEEEINAAVTAMKEAVDVLETKEGIVNTARVALDAYLVNEEYRDAQKTERLTIIATAKADIDAATTAAAIEEIVENAKAQIDEIPTNAELTFEELEESKAAALAKVNAKKATVDYTRYSEEDIAKINELYRAVKETIVNAESEAEMNAAADKFAKDIDALPKTKAANEKAGCSAVVGSGVTFGLAAMLGAALALKKKEEN